MTVPARLQVVVVGVRDLATVRRFYENLGWRSRPRDGLFARFELEGAALVLFPRDQLAEAVGLPVVDGFGGTTPAMMVDDAAALDAALAAAVAAGGTVVAEAADRPWGVRTGYFADPEGTVWEVCALPRR